MSNEKNWDFKNESVAYLKSYDTFNSKMMELVLKIRKDCMKRKHCREEEFKS